MVYGRNLVLLSLAGALALQKAQSSKHPEVEIHIGFDYSYEGPSQPADKSPTFVGSVELTLSHSLDDPWASPVTLVTPLQDKHKDEIIQMGLDLKVPYEHTWTCYNQGPASCGVCSACVSRLGGFDYLGVWDPLKYAGGL